MAIVGDVVLVCYDEEKSMIRSWRRGGGWKAIPFRGPIEAIEDGQSVVLFNDSDEIAVLGSDGRFGA